MRPKSDLRVFIEDYLNSGDEDWLEIPCRTKQETNRVRSIAYSIDRTIIDTSNKRN